MNSERTLFIKHLGLLGLTNVVNTLIGIMLIPIFTKGRPLEDYGTWVQINVSLTLIPGLTCLGLPYTLVRYIAGEKDKSKTREAVYSIFFVVLAVNAVLAPLFAYLIIKYFGNNELRLVPIFAILLFIQAISAVGWNYLRALQKIRKYSILMILQNLLTGAGVGYAIVNGYGIYGALLALFAVRFLMLVILLYEIVSDLGVYMPRFTYMKEFLRFGLPTIPGNLSAWIVSSSDRYLIGYYLGVKYVGYYNPAYSLGSLLNFIIGPLGFLLPATLSKLYEEGKTDEVRLYLGYILKYYLIIAIPAVFGLSILAKPILTIFSTQEIAEKSYLVVPFVALGILFWGLYTLFVQIIVLLKQTENIGKIWMFSAFLNFVGNIILIPKLGIIGAAITTLISYVTSFWYIWRISCQLWSSNLFENLKISILKVLFATAVMSAVCICCSLTLELETSLFQIFFTGSMGLLSYVTMLFLLRVLTRQDIEIVKRYFR
ncbi:oligosaccharide flippase family protein [Pyrococcus kukulkanii]|uniref:oligosaccharide flippase family protein n=1 Tax=Pyrococcus kukulkanii TaxID=1609559 RepID=UPI003567823E